MHLPRRLLPLACAVLALALLAAEARAEEVFILDNGAVLRGRVAREGDGKIVIRLAGFREENTVTVRVSEIVRRYTSVAKGSRPGGTCSRGSTTVSAITTAAARKARSRLR